MAIVEVETVVIPRFDFDILVDDLRLWDEIKRTPANAPLLEVLLFQSFHLSAGKST